jgi:hypothetical protein
LKLLDQIQICLKNEDNNNLHVLFLNIFDNSLSRKWLTQLNFLLENKYHLEKNYCFFGFVESKRTLTYLLDQINQSISTINSANIGYYIDDNYTLENTIDTDTKGINHCKLNTLHRYFEDLQGISQNISSFYNKATPEIKWHIRQLNLLCHEYESLVLSVRKAEKSPMWRRPSQLMCWLNAPRFILDKEDYELFGIETINRQLGGVYVGVNKAIGKHHWEVFLDEGKDSKIDGLTTTTLRTQTEASGDFDIEWANNPGTFPWQQKKLKEFREWLISNNLDPEDKTLTLGHPQVGQVNLISSFGTERYDLIWQILSKHLEVHSIRTGDKFAKYEYNWSDENYKQLQIDLLS